MCVDGAAWTSVSWASEKSELPPTLLWLSNILRAALSNQPGIFDFAATKPAARASAADRAGADVIGACGRCAKYRTHLACARRRRRARALRSSARRIGLDVRSDRFTRTRRQRAKPRSRFDGVHLLGCELLHVTTHGFALRDDTRRLHRAGLVGIDAERGPEQRRRDERQHRPCDLRTFERGNRLVAATRECERACSFRRWRPRSRLRRLTKC